STAYLVIAYFVLVRPLPALAALPVAHFKHERLHFVVIALVAALLLRQWLVLVAGVALAAAEFLAYPALTWVLVLGSAATLALAVTGRRAGPALLAYGTTVGLVLAVSASASLERLRVQYFRNVGKTDNTSTRETLLRIGWNRFVQRPVFGDRFTEDIAVPSTVTGPYRLVPVHNDYLQMAMSGGAVGGAMFLVWCLGAVGLGAWLVRDLRRRGLPDHARLALVAACGLVAMLVSAAFNPIVVNAANSLVLAVLYTVLASTYLVTRRDRGPAALAEPVRAR
ncbi:MAG TPA: O-antigen ligase family protein, partial [Pseudonocardia sp.]|nr:O-antigen ligase family protein [Pseudonocardia sp.]